MSPKKFLKLILFLLLPIFVGGCGDDNIDEELGFQDANFVSTAGTEIRASLLYPIAEQGALLPWQELGVIEKSSPDHQLHDVLLVECESGFVDHPAIGQFLEAGRSVAFLNASESDKERVIGFTGVCSTEKNEVLLVRYFQDSDGKTAHHVYEGPAVPDEFRNHFQSAAAVRAQSTADPIPDDLPHRRVYLSLPGPSLYLTESSGGRWNHSTGQKTSLEADVTLDIFSPKFDGNGNFGSFQQRYTAVAVATKIKASPVSSSSQDLITTNFGGGLSGLADVGWFQYGLEHKLTNNPTPNLAFPVSCSPSIDAPGSSQSAISLTLPYYERASSKFRDFTFNRSSTSSLGNWGASTNCDGVSEPSQTPMDLRSAYYSQDPYVGTNGGLTLRQSGPIGGITGRRQSQLVLPSEASRRGVEVAREDAFVSFTATPKVTRSVLISFSMETVQYLANVYNEGKFHPDFKRGVIKVPFSHDFLIDASVTLNQGRGIVVEPGDF